jgi:NADH-quinone oxidoreductase subunit F
VTEPVAIADTFREIEERAKTLWHDTWNGKPVIMVGAATCGRAAGALEVLQTFRDEIKKHNLDCPVIEVGCMGHCYAEPLAIISKPGSPPICYGYVNPVIAERLVKEYVLGNNPCPEFVIAALEPNDMLPSFQDFPRAQHEQKIILKNCGHIDPTIIEHYIAGGGYAALAKTLEMTPESIIDEIKKSGLRGRGGAGFPTGQKWEFCRNHSGRTKYMICNADEGDPGAFMDRSILESDPHSVIEGMVIAAYAIGARRKS